LLVEILDSCHRGVPQTLAVYRGLSVEDHLSMARSLHSGFDSDYARRPLDQLGIPLDQRADTLSVGQAAQLGLAVALGTRAKVVLLDEPLANLDPPVASSYRFSWRSSSRRVRPRCCRRTSSPTSKTPAIGSP
jgi:ABC-type multidrug transport system ATPase subunit